MFYPYALRNACKVVRNEYKACPLQQNLSSENCRRVIFPQYP